MSFEQYATKFGVEIPFVSLLGFQLSLFENGHSQIDYAPKPEHYNSLNGVHGGVSMTLLDVAMALAARSVDPEFAVLTIEMKTTFMQAAVGDLVAKGHLLKRTSKMAFTQASIYDASGNLCAHATGTFKYVKRITK
ncbi:MAG: hypothetical protein RJB10_1669 [Pseudomonadota bacterium]|jgi:uncharacterized protein (TIGR00369 family)